MHKNKKYKHDKSQPIEFSNDRRAVYDTFSFSLDNMHL